MSSYYEGKTWKKRERNGLTEKIAYEYYNRAKNLANPGLDIGERRELRMELQERCSITELEALNIVNGFHIKDYVNRYKRMEQGIQIGGKAVEEETEEKVVELTEKNYDDWLLQRLIELSAEKE